MWTNHVTLQGVKSYYGRGSRRRAGVNTQPQLRDSSQREKKKFGFLLLLVQKYQIISIQIEFFFFFFFLVGGGEPSWIFHRMLMIPLTCDGEDQLQKVEKKKALSGLMMGSKVSIDVVCWRKKKTVSSHKVIQ